MLIKVKSFIIYALLFLFSNFTSAIDTKELLKPEDAFKFNISAYNSKIIYANWQVAKKYYIYKDKIKFKFIGEKDNTDNPIEITDITYPKSIIIEDQYFGQVPVFRDSAQLKIVLNQSITNLDDVKLKVRYQGCADAGLCYMPITKKIALTDIKTNPMITAQVPTIPNSTSHPSGDLNFVSEQDTIAASLSANNMFITLLSFFGFGLLLAFTPCVFPMIPILSGIIIGQGKETTTKKSIVLSIVYVLSMAFAYTIVGILAGLFGTNLQVWFQNPWILSSFAAIFVLLSLSMFGFYELQMPSRVQVKLNTISNNQQSGSLISAGIMGFLSALIVGPCVTAPLIGALIYIGQTGDATLGGSALFFMSLGMGLPLIVIGASAGKLLPKAGQWMTVIKAVFGVLMLAVAIWLLERILPVLITQVLCAILLCISAIYMGALKQHNENTSQWQLLYKGLGIIILLYSILLLIGVATGKASFSEPLAGYSSNIPNISGNEHLSFKTIKSTEDLQFELQKASENNQSVMLDFYADWCVSCKEMEAYTFTDLSVKNSLENVVTLQADVTDNDDLDKELLKKFGLYGPPAILFFNTDKKEQKPFRIVGYMPASGFNNHLSKVLK